MHQYAADMLDLKSHMGESPCQENMAQSVELKSSRQSSLMLELVREKTLLRACSLALLSVQWVLLSLISEDNHCASLLCVHVLSTHRLEYL